MLLLQGKLKLLNYKINVQITLYKAYLQDVVRLLFLLQEYPEIWLEMVS